MEYIIGFLIGIIAVLLVAIVQSNHRYFNSKVASPKGLDLPEFKVTKIKEAYSTELKTIAEYTVTNCFFKRKGGRGWHYVQYKFYDEIDKYKIGDVITFIK